MQALTFGALATASGQPADIKAIDEAFQVGADHAYYAGALNTSRQLAEQTERQGWVHHVADADSGKLVTKALRRPVAQITPRALDLFAELERTRRARRRAVDCTIASATHVAFMKDASGYLHAVSLFNERVQLEKSALITLYKQI